MDDVEKQLEKVLDILSDTKKKHNKQRNKRVRYMLRQASDQDVIQYIGMGELSKIIYILLIKHNKKLQTIQIPNDVMLRIGETNVANLSYLAVYIHFINIENNVLQIEGNISLPYVLVEKNIFFIKHNGKRIYVDLKECGLDLSLGDNTYEKRSAFFVSIELKQNQNKIEFFNCVEGMECRYGKINSMRFSPVSDCIENQYARTDNWMLAIKGNCLICEKITDDSVWENAEKCFQETCINNNSNVSDIMQLRSMYWQRIHNNARPIWIFMDRPDRADDNAEIFFQYMQQHREIDSYFIIDSECEDFSRIETIGKVVPLYSKEHLLLALLADCIISSQCNGVVENPFWEKAEYVRDIYHKPKIIFLQHGVIKDDMSPTLNRYHTNFTGFVTSTKAEYESILKYPYFYNKKNIWLTGLPVFDTLKDQSEKIILIMPTWRKELMHQEWDDASRNMKWITNKPIEKSEYYRKYYSLLHDKKLLKLCKKYGYKIAFKPHPLMEKYIKNIAGEEVILYDASVTYREALQKGSMLITDYSSIAFLFAYLKKPVIYYQFDVGKFFKNHTYNKGYFAYEENGLGECCKKKSELIKDIYKYIVQNCQVENLYMKRMEELYPKRNQRCCERLYEIIRNWELEK